MMISAYEARDFSCLSPSCSPETLPQAKIDRGGMRESPSPNTARYRHTSNWATRQTSRCFLVAFDWLGVRTGGRYVRSVVPSVNAFSSSVK